MNWPTVLSKLSAASVFCCYAQRYYVPREEGIERETGEDDVVYELDNAGEDEED